MNYSKQELKESIITSLDTIIIQHTRLHIELKIIQEKITRLREEIENFIKMEGG